MKFKYQEKNRYSTDKNNVKIAEVTSERLPFIIDYSEKYEYNQPKQASEVPKNVNYQKLGEDDVLFYLSDIDSDDVVLTNKFTREYVPLYYQYQLRYDVLDPSNIIILDEDNNEVQNNIEYGYIKQGTNYKHRLFSDNEQINFDTLNFRTDIGTYTRPLFTSINSLESQDIYDNLEFNVYGGCLVGGSVSYDKRLIEDASSIEFYFAARNRASNERFTLFSNNNEEIIVDDYVIYYSNGTDPEKQLVELEPEKWYRIQINFNESIRILKGNPEGDYNYPTEDDTYVEEYTYDEEISNDYSFDISLWKGENFDDPRCGLMFDLAIFSEKKNIPWNEPLYVNRYSKSLFWLEDKPTVEDETKGYRVRVLLPDSEQYKIQYDAIDGEGNIRRNWDEMVAQNLVYKKYTNITVQDWYYDQFNNIYFTSHAKENLLDFYEDTGEETDQLEGVEFSVKPTEESLVKVYEENDNVVVQKGNFRSDDFSISEGIYDYYRVSEYDLMPFASDDQTIVNPHYLKNTKVRADVIDSHTIKLNKFYFYEGSYPDYDIPHIIESEYNVEEEYIEEVSEIVSLNYRSARGINIYVNGSLISNDQILNYNFRTGEIQLERSLSLNDEVKVTYLNKVDGFICRYPRIDGKTSNHNSYRIYIRPLFRNYSEEVTDNHIKTRLCYRKLEDGVAEDPLRSCYYHSSDDVVEGEEIPKDSDGNYIPNNEEHPYYKLADITMLESITVKNLEDIGGGIKYDDYFGGEDERLKEFPYSKSYLDIMNRDGQKIPNTVTFIKIPNSLMDQLDFETEEEKISYIKDHIEKHIAAGVFYCLVDEDHELIGEDTRFEPFPNIGGK